MITAQNGIYKLDTDNTSYIFMVTESGHLEHIYYGARVHADVDAIREKHTFMRMHRFFAKNMLAYPEILIYTVLILIIFHLRICALKCLHGERVI